MSLLQALKSAESSASASTSESIEVVVSSISAPINGKYGNYRKFYMNGAEYNVDDSRVFNIQVAKPNAKAILTLNQYVSKKDGEEKTVVSALSFVLPEASGLFVMR
jgi:uncharacterized protein YaiE (UPF0345 family)